MSGEIQWEAQLLDERFMHSTLFTFNRNTISDTDTDHRTFISLHISATVHVGILRFYGLCVCLKLLSFVLIKNVENVKCSAKSANRPTIDLYFIWPHFKNPNYPINILSSKKINNYWYRLIWNTYIVIHFSAISPSPTPDLLLVFINRSNSSADSVTQHYRWIIDQENDKQMNLMSSHVLFCFNKLSVLLDN